MSSNYEVLKSKEEEKWRRRELGWEVKKRAMEAAIAAMGLEKTMAKLEAALADESNGPWVKWLAQAEAATGQPRKNMALGILALFALYLIIGHEAELLCNGIGMAYPAYASMKTIKSVQKDDDTQWLIYWTVFVVFSLIDVFSAKIVYTLPVYWLAKAAFLLWLWCPLTMGAQRLHKDILAPLTDKYEPLLAA